LSSELTQRLVLAVDGHIPGPGRQPEPAVTGPLPFVQHDETWRPAGPRRQPQIPARHQGVVSGWPFRAQLPVRTVAAPEGAFSAQTPPARPFSQMRCRPSSGNVRHPATVQPLRRTHCRLTGCRQVGRAAVLDRPAPRPHPGVRGAAGRTAVRRRAQWRRAAHEDDRAGVEAALGYADAGTGTQRGHEMGTMPRPLRSVARAVAPSRRPQVARCATVSIQFRAT
jgi:hypothetical protein